MKSFRKICVFILICIIAIFIAGNFLLAKTLENSGRSYRVEISRAVCRIEEDGFDALNLNDYPTIIRVVEIKERTQLEGENEDYLIRNINGSLYRFDYRPSMNQKRFYYMFNGCLTLISLLCMTVLLFIRFRIFKPLNRIIDVPYALSKGNAVEPIQSLEKSPFERFGWGMNLLRENVEQQKNRELALLAEKKKLILSISHDIKIPLSAIKLYSKALQKGFYDEKKRQDIAVKIDDKANEIADFVSKIVDASSRDFLSLDVNISEFYLSSLLRRIVEYYSDKLKLLAIDFTLSSYNDCLLQGDEERALEVIQNIVENAIKYGDGIRIAIDVSQQDNCCLIHIANSGCSVSSEEIPHIFDSFWRGSNSHTGEGSGLGLYIAQTLMRKMNGEIYAQRQNDDMVVTVVLSRV